MTRCFVNAIQEGKPIKRRYPRKRTSGGDLWRRWPVCFGEKSPVYGSKNVAGMIPGQLQVQVARSLGPRFRVGDVCRLKV